MKCQLHITQAAFTVESISWGVGALYNILARDKQFTSSIILTAFMTGQQATIPSARAVVSRSRWKMQGVFPHNPLLQFVWSLWDCNSFWELPPQTGCAERGTPPSILSVRNKVLYPAQPVPRLLSATDPFQHLHPCFRIHGKCSTSMAMGKEHPSCPSLFRRMGKSQLLSEIRPLWKHRVGGTQGFGMTAWPGTGAKHHNTCIMNEVRTWVPLVPHGISCAYTQV